MSRLDLTETSRHHRVSALAEIERAGSRSVCARRRSVRLSRAGPPRTRSWRITAVELENLANKYHAVDPEGAPAHGSRVLQDQRAQVRARIAEEGRKRAVP